MTGKYNNNINNNILLNEPFFKLFKLPNFGKTFIHCIHACEVDPVRIKLMPTSSRHLQSPSLTRKKLDNTGTKNAYKF